MYHYHLDVRAETIERPLLHGPAVFEVVVGIEGTDENLYASPVLYRYRHLADGRRDAINAAMFAARCGFCGVSADYIEDIDELLGSGEIDVLAWCSDACREESLTEDAELRRAGL